MPMLGNTRITTTVEIHPALLQCRPEGRIPMSRDHGLEELLNSDLDGLSGLSSKPMFGGWAWLLKGNLLCGARDDGMLARIGKANEPWALEMPGVAPMISRGKPMGGWVRANPDAYGDDAMRRKLLDAALAFNATLAKK